ncbi:Spore protein YabQ [Lentibacillus sp. JNUCC-1]|uniref:spore cortex biosynthesis protein YabQ n=1 Tax=Lentibacillus sp. JNUCC-1 TaxID=2654513 RepID=UPI0012E89B1C|nr:spore cortex biosynthesis protein YabQ [Lentibacillus sp. JNUCC-1]MUV38032.1 Spore protein YabQ [Lentibacillus sp. JNUCC-1]
MTLSVQLMTMIAMISGGFYLGMAQDTHRRLSIHWKNRLLLLYVMEISFWLVQSLLLFYVLFLVNNGELGIYVFLAGLLGYSAYRALAAPTYKRILEKAIAIIRQILHGLHRIFRVLFVLPLKWLFHVLVVTVLFILNLLFSIFIYLFKVIYWPVKWMFKLIYRLMPECVQRFIHKLAGFYSTIENIIKKRAAYFINKWRS